MTLDMNTACLVVLGAALIGGIAHRIVTKKGIGLRFLQFLAIGMGLPTMLMLSFAGKLPDEAVAALLGSVVGILVMRQGKDE
jgi:hypothetical protein